MKAIVEVTTISDRHLLERKEFDTNQEAADFMGQFYGQPVDIKYEPIGFRPMVHSESEDETLFLRTVLDIL
jgi:hypothetical protein